MKYDFNKRSVECCSLFSYKIGSCCCKWLDDGDDRNFPAKLMKKFSEGAEEVKLLLYVKILI